MTADKVEKERIKQGWIEAIRMWNQQHYHVYYLVLPVFVNLMLTLTAWIYVYEMQVEKSPVSFMFFDTQNGLTTGDDFYDGMLNGFVCVASVAVLSFVMLGFALYNFRRLIQFWLSLSCLLIMFCVSGAFFAQLLTKLRIDSLVTLVALTLTYGIVGVFVFFTNKLPLSFHQAYVICNCSLVSLFYLQILPNHTTWFLLSGIVVWDIFAVLAPLGPLRQITEKAQDYSEDILRFLVFSTNVEEHVVEEQFVEICESATEIISENMELHEESFEVRAEWEILQDDESSDECERMQAGSDAPIGDDVDENLNKVHRKTAQDALNDSSARLGMGDFVFYSLLVGKAAVSGSVLATIGAIVGVIIGLVITLTVLTKGDETIPALPVSIFLGMAFHFGILFVVEPMLQCIFVI